MSSVEKNFDNNIAIAKKSAMHECNLKKIKSQSFPALLSLINNKEKFDFIYVDACHKACSVLRDAVLSYELLTDGGVMVFDDYLWNDFDDLALSPKIGLDAFTSCYRKEISYIGEAPISQLWICKGKDAYRKYCDLT